MKKIYLSLIAAVAFFTASTAQVTSVTHSATIELSQLMNLQIASNGLTPFVFDNLAEFSTGITQSAATNFKVTSSVPWQVHVVASGANFTSTDPTSSPMPVSVLSVGKSGGVLLPLTYNPALPALSLLATGVSGTPLLSALNDFTVDYKANPGFSYDPDTYSVDLVYTISAL